MTTTKREGITQRISGKIILTGSFIAFSSAL
jgi:hypothetical protein